MPRLFSNSLAVLRMAQCTTSMLVFMVVFNGLFVWGPGNGSKATVWLKSSLKKVFGGVYQRPGSCFLFLQVSRVWFTEIGVGQTSLRRGVAAIFCIWKKQVANQSGLLVKLVWPLGLITSYIGRARQAGGRDRRRKGGDTFNPGVTYDHFDCGDFR